ncbi:MAG: glycoside hydrolase family 30 protein [Verrucomicrobiota bacterium]
MNADVYLTARDSGHRLSPVTPSQLPCLEVTPRRVVNLEVDGDRECQEIEGFGGAFTEAASTTLDKLPADKQEELLRAYFDPQTGHGYTLCRSHINSCDFSLGNYAYCEKDGDHALESFSIEHDRASLLPMIKRAQALVGQGFKLMGSPWSPPAWMKTNGMMNEGGSLKPECRETWARYFVRYLEEYAKEGVPVWGLTVQNEAAAKQTWDSCLYTAEEERDFVRDYLGPALHRGGQAHVKLIYWDHNRDKIYERAKVMLDDPEAAKYIWATGFHWYGSDAFGNVARVHEAWPDKKLLFTEGCQEGTDLWGSWLLGERYGRSIIQDLNNWTVGWMDWNLLLDETGGPNHVQNLCLAPVMADTRTGTLDYQSSYYYLGHFSRFIKPGARRLLSSSGHDALELLAARNPDGSVAVVVMNRQERYWPFTITLGGERLRLNAPARSILTTVLR